MEAILISLITQAGSAGISWIVKKWLTKEEPTAADWLELSRMVNVKLEDDLKAALARAGIALDSSQGKILMVELLKITTPTLVLPAGISGS